MKFLNLIRKSAGGPELNLIRKSAGGPELTELKMHLRISKRNR